MSQREIFKEIKKKKILWIIWNWKYNIKNFETQLKQYWEENLED